MSEVDIVIRSEPSLKYFVTRLTNDGFKVESKQIPVDYVIYTDSEPIGAERKASGDFLRSIKDGALWEQIHAMLEFTTKDKAYILLEDVSWPWTLKHSHMNPHAIVGAFHTASSLVKVLPTLTREGTYLWLRDRLEEAKGLNSKNRNYSLRASANRQLSPEEQAIYIAQGFPELGGARIKELTEAFDCLYGFLTYVDGGSIEMPTPLKELSTRVKNLIPFWNQILNADWKKGVKND